MEIFHKHHIIPRHSGGSDDEENLISLSIEEHSIAHKILWEKYHKWQDYLAYMALSGQISGAEIAQQKRVLANTGKNVTSETREKLRLASSGRIPSEKTREKMSKNNCMKRPEHRIRHSETMKNSMKGNKNGTGGKASSGMVKINDGQIERFITKEDSIPPNWQKGRLRRKWITNGIADNLILESDEVQQGWQLGRSTARGCTGGL